jgi:hypothetical protein
MQRVLLMILVIQLAACSGDTSSSASDTGGGSAANASAPPQSSGPLAISGAPVTSVALGTTYGFTPVASDSESKNLTFSIQNKPTWASFNSETGEISGTPTSADVGTYSNIIIGVSDGAVSVALQAFSISVTQIGTGSATLSWFPPTTDANGEPLTNLAGYKIHYGTNAESLTETITITNPGISTYVVSNLSPGNWYFSVTAFNTYQLQSNFSSVVSKTIQ